MKRKTGYNSTFTKWRVEEVLVRSVFIITFVASRQVEAPNPPIANLRTVSGNYKERRHKDTNI
jgi:hypothetical protein